MRLPRDRKHFFFLDDTVLRAAILERREVIRGHRDAKGDDRCWVDDFLVWDMLDGESVRPLMPLVLSVGMVRCEEFYRHRRMDSELRLLPGAIQDPALWNRDLPSMDREGMLDELANLQYAIYRHRESSPVSLVHDLTLYMVLPEKLPADFRLPPRPEFLGEAKEPHAGCPSFWRSHRACDSMHCTINQWGPCVP